MRTPVLFFLPWVVSCWAAPVSAPVSFDVQDAFTHVYLAYAAFCPGSQLESWTCEPCSFVPGFKTITYFDPADSNATGYVGFVNSTIVASFRGTVGWENILEDIEFWTVTDYPDFPGAMVHYGFHSDYLSVQAKVHAAVDQALQLCPHCTSAVCTGHSLGAALSGFCATDLALRYPQLAVSVKNFGMPRIGNEIYANNSNRVLASSWRMVYWDDPVPHVPPQFVFGYHHIATEIWNNPNGTNNGTFIICTAGNGEDPYCSDSVPWYDYVRADHMNYMGIHNYNCQNNQP